MWKKREDYVPDVTVIVALFNGQQTGVPHSVGVYTTEWVEKLYRGIARNYSGPFGFICLTDQNYKFSESNIRQVGFDRSVDQYGWMSLMELYRPELCAGTRITMGLDTIITGSLDKIFAYTPEKFAVCNDPFEPGEICNAVTIATLKFCEYFWPWWLNNEKKLMKECTLFEAPSEMILMRKYFSEDPVVGRIGSQSVTWKSYNPTLDTLFPEIVSYKMHIQTNFVPLRDASIVYFHGEPKPHIINDKWIQENWI